MITILVGAYKACTEYKAATAVANFEDDPDTYSEALQKVLTRLAENNPAFAAQLQALAQQHSVALDSVTGSVNVSDSAKVDQAAGVNTGTMTYNAGQKNE